MQLFISAGSVQQCPLGSITDKSDHRQLVLALMKSQQPRATLLEEEDRHIVLRRVMLLVNVSDALISSCLLCPIVSKMLD